MLGADPTNEGLRPSLGEAGALISSKNIKNKGLTPKPNGIEGFWSLLKRGINGSFHHVSAKHISRYLNEFMWRFNNRQNERILESLLGNCNGKVLAYGSLIA